MNEVEKQVLQNEWIRNETQMAKLPVNHAERKRLETRQNEIEFQLGEGYLSEPKWKRLAAFREKRPKGDVPPPVLYKYVKIEVARRILIEDQLRLTCPKYFNDPFDCKWHPLWSIYTPDLLERTAEAVK